MPIHEGEDEKFYRTGKHLSPFHLECTGFVIEWESYLVVVYLTFDE
jgi:hypothetical protein